jgi:hypothetical protein
MANLTRKGGILMSQNHEGKHGGHEGKHGGHEGASPDTTQEILDALKNEGITDLDSLAAFVASKASQTDEQGNPGVANTIIVSPHYVISH